MKNNRFCEVLRELRDSGPSTRREMAAALDTTEDAVWHHFATLSSWGLVRPCGYKGRAVLFELAPKHTPAGKPYARRGTLSKTTSA